MSLSQTEFGILGVFILLIYSETKKLRAIESNGKLISLNAFMENKDHTGGWQDAPEYLSGLEVISEEAVKYHFLFMELATISLDEHVKSKTLDAKEESACATDLGYVLDYSTIGQFPEQLTKDKYNELKEGKISRIREVMQGSMWAMRSYMHWKDPVDNRFITAANGIKNRLLRAVVLIELGGIVLALWKKAGEQTTCADTLIHHLAGPDCNYSCVLIDPEPFNASHLNASLLSASSI